MIEIGKKYTILMVLICGISCISAVNADEFLIGAYSQYQIRYAGANYPSDFDSLASYLNRAGYNAAVYSQYTGDDEKLPVVMDKFHRHRVKSMLFDNTWTTGSSRVGVSSLGFGNSLQIEAEYQFKGQETGVFEVDYLDTPNQQINPDSYDYVCNHDTGMAVSPDRTLSYSNDWAWTCRSDQGDQPGIALSMPRKRWKPSYQAWPSLLSRDIVFLNSALSDNSLSITFALRFDNVAPGNPVADICLKLYVPPDPDQYSEYCIPDPADYVSVALIPSEGHYQCQIIAQDYPQTMLDEYGNLLFQYKVDLLDLRDYMKGSYPTATREFYHISPEIYWHGTGNLEIDYVLIEDEFTRTARQDFGTPYLDYLENQISRLESLDSHNNIAYYMGMDEPRPGQLSIYRYMQEYLNSVSSRRKMITAVNLNSRQLVKHNNEPYNHPLRFLSEVRPDRIMVDFFPLQWGTITYNDDTESGFSVQTKIDSLFHYYAHRLVNTIHHSDHPDMDIFFVPQTFGIVREDTGDWSYNMPPLSMMMALKLLPLCYAADGTVDFCLTANPEDMLESGYWVSPLIHDRNYGLYDNLRPNPKVSAYQQITKANAKLSIYGPIIKNLSWINANKIMPNGIETYPLLNNADYLALETVLLHDLHVSSGPDSTGYSGFIQCGYYRDPSGIPSFMLVNRRAVYERSNAQNIPLDEVDRHFANAQAQTVCFQPTDLSHKLLGTHLALYDAYNQSLMLEEGDSIYANLEAGDGRLLELCSSLPQYVSEDAELRRKVRLSGTHTIDRGAIVSIEPGSSTIVSARSTIIIKNGARLIVRGDFCVGDSVTIIAENRASLILEDAKCYWGQGAVLKINGASLQAINGTWEPEKDWRSWRGIRASAGSTIILEDMAVSGADSINIINSNLGIYDCTFQIGSNSEALYLQNTLPGYSTQIINSKPDCGFYGRSSTSSGGISLGTMSNPVTISHVVFYELDIAILKSSSPQAIDSISNCRFINCSIGIWLVNNANNTTVNHCNFVDNRTQTKGIGMVLIAANPQINSCSFHGLQQGILAEFSVQTNTRMPSGIYDASFYDCEVGFESRSASHRIVNSLFKRNYYGIVNHAGSNLFMSFGAANRFQNKLANMLFVDTYPYESMTQLFAGHNDFYHSSSEHTGSTIDFQFGAGYHSSPVLPSHGLDVSYNWFEDSHPTIADYAYYPMVLVQECDPSEDLAIAPPEQNRLCMAYNYEAQGLYKPAASLYKTIIDEGLRRERAYLSCALDGYYRCATAAEDAKPELKDAYRQWAEEIGDNDPILLSLIRDYHQRASIFLGDYQDAIDLIELRLDNPITTIDSLRAVLDIQIVLYLAMISESQRPYSTHYSECQYSDAKLFRSAHQGAWELYTQALGEDDPEPGLLLEPNPTIINLFPNPFEQNCTLVFSIPQDMNLLLSVYNVRGQKVKDLLDTKLERGIHKLVWDATDSRGRQVDSGIYFFKLESFDMLTIRKAILLK